MMMELRDLTSVKFTWAERQKGRILCAAWDVPRPRSLILSAAQCPGLLLLHTLPWDQSWTDFGNYKAS